MIQLDEYLTKKGHDNHMVAKITKKIGEWSPRKTAGETAALTQGNLEDETEECRGLGAEGYRGLIPAGSELPDPEESSEVDTPERPDKRHRAEKIKKLGGTPQQRREQIRAFLLPGYYVCESGKTRIRILHQLGACWMVPGVDCFSFVHHGLVASSPEAKTKVCKWCAAKVGTKESDDSGLVVVHHLERFLKRARRSSRIWNEILDVWEFQKT